MLSSPVVLISGGNLVPFSNYAQLRLLIRIFFLSHILNRINEVIAYLPSGYFAGQRDARAVMWMAICEFLLPVIYNTILTSSPPLPVQSMCIIQTFVLPTWLGGKVAVFTSSGSQKAELNERDPVLRAPLWRRLRFAIWDCSCYIHIAFILFALASVGLSTYWNIHNHTTTKDILIALLTHAGWPPLIWLTSVLSCWAPIAYAIWPPDCPDRQDLLERDPKTNVAYPKESSKSIRFGWATWIHEVLHSILTIYTCGLLVISFWIK